MSGVELLAPDAVQLDGTVVAEGAQFLVLGGSCDGRRVVVKVLADPTSEADVAAAEEIIEREFQALRKLRHESVARAHGLWRLPDGRLGLVREYAEGVPLSTIIERNMVRHNYQGARRWTPATREILRKIGEGLIRAHRKGVSHNDIKPDNVIVRKTRDGEIRAVLLDFGQAGAGARGGTIAYAAPERIEGKEGTPRSDVYSLGLLTYKMLSGTLPYDGTDTATALVQRKVPVDRVPRQSASRAWRDMPAVVRAALVKALDADPRKRPRSVAALLRLLEIERRPAESGVIGSLVAAVFATVLALILMLPLSDGPVARRLLERPDSTACEQTLAKRAKQVCAAAGGSPAELRRCETGLSSLSHPSQCAARVRELGECPSLSRVGGEEER